MAGIFKANHPVWNILRLVIIFGGLTFFMYLNEGIDESKVQTILETAAVLAGFELFRRKVSEKPKD